MSSDAEEIRPALCGYGGFVRDENTQGSNGHLQAGTILIQEGVLLPREVHLESRSYSDRWRSVQNLDGSAIDKLIRAAGWSFMFLGEHADATVLGSSSDKNVRRALDRILQQVQSRNFNAVEVTGISQHRCCGVPYVSVRAHPRHIQSSQVLQGDAQRKLAQHDEQWSRD
ncbi:MAG: hypothetical protein AB7O65_07910 [Candidatus Korobacteraceae bacterium]